MRVLAKVVTLRIRIPFRRRLKPPEEEMEWCLRKVWACSRVCWMRENSFSTTFFSPTRLKRDCNTTENIILTIMTRF